jgi:NDP-sugar pyrophosphorylase family protein
VSIGPGVTIAAGVRIRDSIVLGSASIGEHAYVCHSIVGWNSSIGTWARVEGTPNDPNPDKPFAKMENLPLFGAHGKLNPAITILGENRIVRLYLIPRLLSVQCQTTYKANTKIKRIRYFEPGIVF